MMTFIVRKKILGATKYVKGEDGTYYNGYYLKMCNRKGAK